MPILNSNIRRNAIDLTGRKFGRWTVIRYYDKIVYKYAAGSSTCLRWLCRCECGEEKIVRGNTLTSGRSVSCRCYQREFQRERHTTHGHTANATVSGKAKQTPEYAAWAHMMQRCYNPKCSEYSNYGARGIAVCESWKDAANFLADMGKKPTSRHSLERINNNGNYEPSNCRWDTNHNQQRNKRTNRMVTWDGRTQCAKDWAVEMKVNPHALNERLRRGWSVERTMTTPFSSRAS